MNRRISRFIKWGVPLVWLVDPEEQTVTVYRPDGVPDVLERVDELTGSNILPDFRCRVAEFFFMPSEANGGETTPASS
ncbi:MAG: Uma2 family endonuclease [Gemmataceae bacterium]